jgi:sugar phosphate isomerase/epimerase
LGVSHHADFLAGTIKLANCYKKKIDRKAIMQQPAFVGVTVAPFEGFSPSDLIRGVRLLGMDFVEINRSSFTEIDRVAENLGQMITAFHLPLVFDDGWDFSSLNHHAEIDETIDILNSAKERLKIHHIVAHPPETAALTHPEHSSLDFHLDNLKRLSLPIYLENVPEVPAYDFERIYHIAQDSLGAQLAGMCFDAPHFYITGNDPLEQFQHYRKNIGCIHLSDCLKNDDSHLPFNCGGTLPVIDFLQRVGSSKFSGYITLEIKPPSLGELDAYIDSYLTTLQYVNYNKYLKTRLRLFALRPLLNRYKSYYIDKKVA